MTVRNLLLTLLPLVLALAEEPPGDLLALGFRSPPASARPWVYWFPLSGNLTREGITADLEAMRRVGIGGVLYMEVDQGAPKGPADFAGPLWRELFRHACSEAQRLGLEINMNNDAGWCGSGGPWITPALSMQKVVWSESLIEGGRQVTVTLPSPKANKDFYEDIAVLAMPAPEDGAFRLPDIEKKAAFKPGYAAPASADLAPAPANAIIPSRRMVTLTASMDAAGTLTWEAPAGKWLVLRFGHTTTGKDNHPAPDSGRGLECDKFSTAAVAAQYDGLMAKLVADNRPLVGAGKVLVSTHIDSWEVGSQNWTPRMGEEFQARRGYDMTPYLPVFTGRVVDSVEVSERFLWDLRLTVSDLIIGNYAGEMRRLANRDGLRLSIEAYDGAPVDDLAYGGQADEPMAEFWSWARYGAAYSCCEMASSAHIYGRRILGAEAFTATNAEKWLGHPALIKDIGDWAFCEGINRFVFHRYAAQPWLDRAPGMSMGPWGLHYERTQTWWEQSTAWHAYLARCQYLLQQGLYAADILYLQPEGAPRRFTPPADADLAPHVRGGYGYDGCSTEVVLSRLSVSNGRLVLPDGMSYRVLVLPSAPTMTLRLLRRLRELVEAGATILADAHPPSRSPSLADLGAGDAEVKTLAAALWPRLATGTTAAQLLGRQGVPPDFAASGRLRYIHRTLGDAEVYFVANPEPHPLAATCTFRVAGKVPACWLPDTGRTGPALAWSVKDGVTSLPLQFDPHGSLFVVFRPPGSACDPIIGATRDGAALGTPPQPGRILVQKARYGILDDPGRTREVTAKVQALVDAGTSSFRVARLADGDDPAVQVVKTLEVDYTVDGTAFQDRHQDPDTVNLARKGDDPAAAVDFVRGEITRDGDYRFSTAGGGNRQVVVALPAPQELASPWEVEFDPRWGGPGKVVFTRLDDWRLRPEPGIRYYSGTARYRTTFTPVSAAAPGRVYLDLGTVEVMAEVKLNGQELGILWKPPYRVEVTGALRPGENQLEVAAVNLWVNRQIGDEQLPEDSERTKAGTLKAWPAWLAQGQPSPSGRYTFTSWRLWKKSDPLVASGLLGPVRLVTVMPIPER